MKWQRALTIVQFFVLAWIMMACAANPVKTSKTNNKEVSVDLLFTHDGCNVYRFEDDGQSHYYAVCGQSVTTTMQKIGKHGEDEVPTLYSDSAAMIEAQKASEKQ